MNEDYLKNIRNFVIIAHIDAGKSTLADRFLEITQTVDQRKMKPQYLDQMELERERGITIKMAPVKMKYILNNQEYILNLIDTPGHSDFSYEVSRALAAVEGAILLIDATKGIQAQTLANLEIAKRANIKILGVINKIDIFNENDPRIEELKNQVSKLINCVPEKIFLISAKTGKGVNSLLEKIIKYFPPPPSQIKLNSEEKNNSAKALIFDSIYDENKGVITYVRIFNGYFKEGDIVNLYATQKKFKIKEVGYFKPELAKTNQLLAGEIGYIATGIKEPSLIYVGDSI